MSATSSGPDRRPLSFGSWPSPVPADLLVAGAAVPTGTWAEGGITWWSQRRPAEGGRTQVSRRDPDGSVRDLFPAGWDVRTRAHEYGGAAWWVHRGVVFATSWADQRLYRLDPDAELPVPLTPEPAHPHGLRYADGRVSADGATVICVRESHPAPGPGGGEDVSAVRNEIVALPAHPARAPGDPAEPVVLVCGPDFVAAPRISPDGRRLAWLAWDHPDMPWDSTAVWVGELDGRELTAPRRVAGGAQESLLQPEWGADGSLYLVSDRSDWWNVYRVEGLDSARPELVAVHPVAAEVGLPAWAFGQSRYATGADGTVWFCYDAADGAHLVTAGPGRAPRDTVVVVGGAPATGLVALRLDAGRLVAIAGQRGAEAVVVELDPASGAAAVLCPARELHLDPAAVSLPEQLSFPSTGGRTAHAWFYPPASAVATGPQGELPPLLVLVHGGPTGAADPSFRLSTQFWTSRGFAVVDVDYGGSTGYGRPYRRLLDGGWGVVDVDDACAAATWLADQGRVDAARLAIRGGSAGGFTTLAALATRTVFAAGASHYGVADLAALARDTHKFESRYQDRLVGPYPEAAAVYEQRSPLTHVDGFDRPLIVLQGDEDAVVPPAQAELIVQALRSRGVPHAYLLFAGEQHGFRQAANIVRAITAELYFYSRVFGFTPAEDLDPVPIAFADKLNR